MDSKMRTERRIAFNDRDLIEQVAKLNPSAVTPHKDVQKMAWGFLEAMKLTLENFDREKLWVSYRVLSVGLYHSVLAGSSDNAKLLDDLRTLLGPSQTGTVPIDGYDALDILFVKNLVLSCRKSSEEPLEKDEFLEVLETLKVGKVSG